jgi:glycosyltransferase involved in cell wall biosynthesis
MSHSELTPLLNPALDLVLDPVLDIVIPVKERITIERCVLTLIAQMLQTKGLKLGRILLCDGGSRTMACCEQLEKVSQWPAVEVLSFAHKGFNKAWLLNQGLQAASAPIVITSDVDILWPAETLEAMAIAAAVHPSTLYHVQAVQESEPDNVATQRSRYTYRLIPMAGKTTVELSLNVDVDAQPQDLRPGCGLVCARRSLWQQIGGYRHCFQGWGWEDQDLLMRAQLLGYRVLPLGTVTHLSHGDSQRNAFAGQLAPQESRDLNIRLCLAGLASGKLRGDLPLELCP